MRGGDNEPANAVKNENGRNNVEPQKVEGKHILESLILHSR